MAITYVGGQTRALALNESTVTFSLTGGIASTPADGDVVIVSVSLANNTDSVIGVLTSGYEEIAELYANGVMDTNLSVSWKRMSSTPDTSVDVSTLVNTGNSASVVVQVFRGVDATTPFDVTSTTTTGSTSARPNPAAITPTTTGTLIVVAASCAHDIGATGTLSAPYLSNFTPINNISGSLRDVATSIGSIAWTSGVYDPAIWTFGAADNTNYSNTSVTMALRPALLADLAVATTESQDTASFDLLLISSSALAVTEAADIAAFTAGIKASAALATTEAADTTAFSLAARTNTALAATEAADTTAFSLAARTNTALAATEATDTAAFSLAARTNAALAATEARDTASFGIQFGGLIGAALAATEARDTASLSITRRIPLVAADGQYNQTGYDAAFAFLKVMYADTTSYSLVGHPATLGYARSIFLQSGNYTVTGNAAHLYESAFFYIDSEVIYVPQEVSTLLIPPAALDADEPIVVPDEIQRLSLGFEDRQIAVPADEPIEELTEYRDAVGEARMRMA